MTSPDESGDKSNSSITVDNVMFLQKIILPIADSLNKLHIFAVSLGFLYHTISHCLHSHASFIQTHILQLHAIKELEYSIPLPQSKSLCSSLKASSTFVTIWIRFSAFTANVFL